jgi:lipoate-protein ligase A
MNLRIIEDAPRSAAFNMAADLYLLKRCEAEEIVFVRLYRWRSPSITFGYMQQASELLDLAFCARRNAEWIRRPTGGRAVLHHNDLTYCCVFSRAIQSMGTSVSSTYRILSECLLAGLRAARVAVDTHDSALDTAAVRKDQRLPCFLAPNRDEIMVAGKKLVGSAQKRTAAGVLQHGSIPLNAAFRELPRYQNISRREQEIQIQLLERKCTCIEEACPGSGLGELIQSLKKGFGDVLRCKVAEKPWTDEEAGEIEALAASDRFADQWMSPKNPSWQWPL